MAKKSENGRLVRVMILNETTGRMAFDVSTDEQLYQVSLMIVNERRNAGHYPEPTPSESADFHAQTVRTLPPSLQDFARKKLGDFRESARRYEEAKEQYERMLAIVENQNGPEAFAFLTSRMEFEGEDFDIITVSNNYVTASVDN